MRQGIVAFTAKDKAELETREFNQKPQGDEVLCLAEYSAISAGTELANYHALPNTGTTGYLGMEHGDEFFFPFYPGYSSVGTVLECGPDVKGLKRGDRVVMPRVGHVSSCVRSEKDVMAVPADVDPQEAAFSYISTFPILGVRRLELQLGESCMVAGLGILGQIALQVAKLSGACPVLACDMSPERRELALAMGADYVFDPAAPDFIDQVLAATHGKGPAAVVEVTGKFAALKEALKYIGWMGRVTLLGCTRISDDTIDFYRYVHKKGVSIIGCHTSARPLVDSRQGGWTEMDDLETYLKFTGCGRLKIRPLIGRVVKPEDATDIYHEIGFSKTPPLGVLFDWRNWNHGL